MLTPHTYTDRGDVATVTDAEGYVISYEYDGNHNMVKKTTVDGDTTYVYDPLDRLISTTTPDGKSESNTYDGNGNLLSHTDKGGHTTRYVYDGNGKVVQTIDALGNIAAYEYDLMGNLTKTTLHRVDTQDGVDEYEVTLYEYDGRGLTTRVIDALGNVTVHQYDGNGNLVKTTDADGFVTEYSYSALDLVENINYNGGKQVNYAYNKTGDLVEMTDWTGTTTFEIDLLHRITATTDRLGKHVAYTYDEVGNQTAISYPDGTAATKEYDLVHNLTKVTEEDGRTTRYTYDGMARLTHMDYPDGWQEDYTYDAIGQLLSIYDTDPSGKDLKQQKNSFEYDDCGNLTHEYMRGNGTGESTTEVFYTYDELHRVTSAKENYGNASRNYQYDSLGNLTYESNSNNVHYDYKINNLNQVTEKFYGVNDKERTVYTYDGRGNLILEEYAKNNGNGNRSTVAEYTYDETNKMVKGENGSGESSSYFFNGLGALVQQTWVIAKNGYGYHDVQADENDPTILIAEAGIMLYANGNGNGHGNGQGNGNGSGDKPTGSTVNNTSTVVKQFVIDYTVETLDPLAEHEVNGLDYRYVYGFQNLRLSVNISPIDGGAGSIVETGTVGEQIRLYYHQDLRGTVDYLTSPVSQKVESWTHYNEWGEITHNAVVKCGYREFDLVKNYTGHEYDAVLNLYYAKARMYDAENRRFTSVDPILDASRYDISEYVTDPMQLVQYIYVQDNPLIFVDPLGLLTEHLMVNNINIPDGKWYYTSSGGIRIDLVELGRASANSYGYKTAGYTYDPVTGRLLKRPDRGYINYNNIEFEFAVDESGFNSYAYTVMDGFHSIDVTFVKKGMNEYYIDLDEFKKYAPEKLTSYIIYYTFDSEQELYDYIYNELLPPFIDIIQQYDPKFGCRDWVITIGASFFAEGSVLRYVGPRYSSAVGLSIDSKGNVGWLISSSFGGSLGTAGGGGAFVAYTWDGSIDTNHQSITIETGASISLIDMPRLGADVMGSYGIDFSWSLNNNLEPNGLIISLGAGVGDAAEGHIQITSSSFISVDLTTLNYIFGGSKIIDSWARAIGGTT